MNSNSSDIVKSRRDIEYKRIIGNDLIRLYDILISVADHFNAKEIENLKNTRPESVEYYIPYTPTYTIEKSDSEQINGSNIDNFKYFITTRKTSINSISFDFRTRNNSIYIYANSVKSYFNYYEIKGDSDWVAMIKEKLNEIIDDMGSLSSATVFVTKHDFLSTFSFVGVMYIILAYYIIRIDLEMVTSNFSWLGALYTMLMLFLYDKISYYYKSHVEFKLNDEYIDPKSKKRNTISKLLGGFITLYTVIQIASTLFGK